MSTSPHHENSWLSLALMTFALLSQSCNASAVDSGIVLEEQMQGLGSDPPPQFLDSQGQLWVRTQQKVEYFEGKYTPPPAELSTREPAEMELEEAVEYFRPRRLIGDSEYTLSDEDAAAFAAMMLDSVRGNQDGQGEGALPEGAVDTWQPGGDVEQSPDPVVLKHGLIGTDNRFSVSNAGYPWNNTATLAAPIPNTNQTAYCSGFKAINHYTMVTAAHCLHSGSAWLPRPFIGFGGQSAGLHQDCWFATVPGCWTNGSDPECDYAVVGLRGGGAWCPESEYDVGYLGWKSVGTGGDIDAFVTGYPSPGEHMKSGWSYPILVYDWRYGGYGGYTYTGMVFYTNDAVGGQSGANYTSFYGGTDYKARGIQKGVFDSSENWGRKFTQGLVDWFTPLAGY